MPGSLILGFKLCASARRDLQSRSTGLGKVVAERVRVWARHLFSAIPSVPSERLPPFPYGLNLSASIFGLPLSNVF